MEKRKNPIKRRNPVALALQIKRCGGHGKSRKAERRNAKIALRREYPSWV